MSLLNDPIFMANRIMVDPGYDMHRYKRNQLNMPMLYAIKKFDSK